MIKYIFSISCSFVLFYLRPSSAATTDTLHIFSTAMQKEIPALIIVPDVAAGSDRLPAVYLLHGYSGKYTDWSDYMDLGKLADSLQIYLVCPDGDFNSWYINSPIQKDSQYESHIINEVIPGVDSLYNTISTKEGRAISGLSMGGHGALYLAIRHNALFCAAGSMSGAVDLTAFPGKWEIDEKLGSFETNPERWRIHSIINMIAQIKANSFAVRIDCGTDDIFIENNRQLHERLLEFSIPHSYYERPGKHSWDYWINTLPHQMEFFNEHFKR